jgi:hypothetical protein
VVVLAGWRDLGQRRLPDWGHATLCRTGTGWSPADGVVLRAADPAGELLPWFSNEERVRGSRLAGAATKTERKLQRRLCPVWMCSAPGKIIVRILGRREKEGDERGGGRWSHAKKK